MTTLEERGCVGKTKLGERAARNVATRAREREGDETIGAYRCPWCSDWHVGHLPSVETLEQIAAELRARSGNAPGPVHE